MNYMETAALVLFLVALAALLVWSLTRERAANRRLMRTRAARERLDAERRAFRIALDVARSSNGNVVAFRRTRRR